MVRRGEVNAGIEHLRRSQAMLYETRHRIMTTVFATALAEGLATLNQFEAALHTIDAAIAQIGDGGESFDLPEMLRVKGHILVCSGHTAEAENYLLRSIEISRHQSALGWELRAAVTLGRLWQQSGRDAEVHALIAPLLPATRRASRALIYSRKDLARRTNLVADLIVRAERSQLLTSSNTPNRPRAVMVG